MQEMEAAAKAEEEERRAAEARFEELQRKMREAEERCAQAALHCSAWLLVKFLLSSAVDVTDFR